MAETAPVGTNEPPEGGELMGSSTGATEARAGRDFSEVYRRLRQILDPLRSRFTVTRDGPAGLAIEIPGLEGKPWGYIAGVRPGKRYVSFYLMSVYSSPELMASMSPELRRRMQGKACFNFTKVDEPLLAELARLTEAGLEPFVAIARQADRERTLARSR
jgi:hypothetical protein